jgi:hypothetical protein
MWIKNITVVNKIFYLWRKMEESGEWSTLKKRIVRGEEPSHAAALLIPHKTIFVKHIYIQYMGKFVSIFDIKML